MAEILRETTFETPAVEAQAFDKDWIYMLVAHAPTTSSGTLRLELVPFDGQTLGPSSGMVKFESDKLFEVLAAVPEAALAFEMITRAVPALLAYQKAQAELAAAAKV